MEMHTELIVGEQFKKLYWTEAELDFFWCELLPIISTPNYHVCVCVLVSMQSFWHRRREKPSVLIEPAQKLLSLRATIAVGVLCRFFDHEKVLKESSDVSHQ